MKNCYYVTRSIISPWEWKPGQLRYYDFSCDQILPGESDIFFSKSDSCSPRLEELLNRYIEGPIADFAGRPIEERYNPSDLDWPTLRALLLYFLLQTPKVGKAKDMPTAAYLDRVLDRGEPFLDQVARSVQQEHKLVNLPTEPGHFLFFPEEGMFPFPVQDTGCITGYTYAFAVPLTPRNCLALVSNTVTDEDLKESCRALHAFSAGRPANDFRILIPPIAEELDEPRLAQGLGEYRRLANTIIECVTNARDLVAEAYAKIGITIEPIEGSFADRCRLPGKTAET